MSLLLKAFPHGRPRSTTPRLGAALVLSVALVLTSLPALVAPASAQTSSQIAQQNTAAKKAAKKKAKKKAATKKAARKKAAKKARVPGQPPRNYVMPQGSYFAYPNKGAKARLAIRNRLLYTIQSVWGGPRDALGSPLATNGTIRIVTWTFDDWRVARALVAAKKRGVTVQIIVARHANRGHASWRWLRGKLGTALYRPKHPETNLRWSFARECRGSCRGRFGTAHAKYMLFSNVGAAHVPKVTVQTSANLTWFAVTGQWNQAQVVHSQAIYNDFFRIFWQARLHRPQPVPFHTYRYANLRDYFFPMYRGNPASDPVSQILSQVRCTGATAGGTGRTTLRINQYAIYGSRGEWLARQVRSLWQQGCDVAVIYSVASRPVLTILRSRAGRGPVPMRQSVVTNGYGIITKYNHSKWMTVVGRVGENPVTYLTLSGSANWADLAMGSDEQLQLIDSRAAAAAYLRNFAVTWRQRSSHLPGFGVMPRITGRVLPTFAPDVPENAPDWGRGVFKYMTP